MRTDRSRRPACDERHVQTERVCLETFLTVRIYFESPLGSVKQPLSCCSRPFCPSLAHKHVRIQKKKLSSALHKKNIHPNHFLLLSSSVFEVGVRLNLSSIHCFFILPLSSLYFSKNLAGWKFWIFFLLLILLAILGITHSVDWEMTFLPEDGLQYFWIQYWFRNCQPAFRSQLILPDLVGRLCNHKGLCFSLPQC